MKLAVVFHNLGPYHAARLRAATAAAPPGSSLVAVELSGLSREYAWADPDAGGVDRVTVYPGGDTNDLPRSERSGLVAEVLDRIGPTALAVAGWADPGMLAAARWGLRRQVPMVVMSDSQHHDERRIWWKEFVKRQVVGSFGAGFVAGTTHAAYLARLGMPRDRIFLGYDVVDNDYFAARADAARADAARVKAELVLPERYFLACARFIPKKNLSTVLAGFARYRAAAGPEPCDLVFVGDGPLRPELEAGANQLGVSSAVRFAGFRQYPELPAYYGLATGFVHASSVEQWGLVVNEAMASGLPVVVSRPCGCVPDLVTDGQTGFVFDPADPAGLADRLCQLASDPARAAAMGSAAKQRVREWSLDRFAASLWAAAAVSRSETGLPSHVTLWWLRNRR